MSLHHYRPVANGLRTDHPIPDLPFVDDSHIPLEDPHQIEAVGRRKAEGMWGREDPSDEGGWCAFTTDPIRIDLAWCVRWHPLHGRTVLLCRDDDASSMHTMWQRTQLLFRSGGYWWDGTTWYRPAQVWDRASEDYARRPVPAAMTVDADTRLGLDLTNPDHGTILQVIDVDPDAAPPGNWIDHLALWAQHRRPDDRPLTACVVQVTAPELVGDQLVGVPEMAQIGGVAASTLRAYLSRGENDVPPPQVTRGRTTLWARPVALEWAERRRTSGEGIAETMSAQQDDITMSVGKTDLWQRLTRMFYIDLWERSGIRKRWALRWRTETAVQEVAKNLGWTTAASLDRIIPVHDLGHTIRQAILDDFATSRQFEQNRGEPPTETFYGILHPVARMLDWLIRHEPALAASIVGEIAQEARQRLDIPRDVVEHSLGTALSLDGVLDYAVYDEFLHRVLPLT